ncbi:MAG: excinuclease ABC subunit UvrC [bacterium]|jgi:excinuclease ABC subunit C
MTDQLKKKLDTLPLSPGVYFHKDKNGKVIYIGKAANLKNRVKQYFQSSRLRDPKTIALIAEISDVDWMVVDTELDALFLEAELIRRNLPKYNILLRDDKSYSYIRINYNDPYPSVTVTRNPLDDKARYYGPYLSSRDIKSALRLLRKIFPYSTHNGLIPKRACLHYHLGLCPGLEEDKTSLNEYRANLRMLMSYIEGNRVKLIVDLEKNMHSAAKKKDFERASLLRNKIYALKALTKQRLFTDSETIDISKDQAITGLIDILTLEEVPRRIEGYDISHMQGTDNVASMVVFKNGLPEKSEYRKFKMRLAGNNDFAHMFEVISRRLSPKNVKAWGLPNLILIDGGRGQLSSAIKARDELGYKVPMIGLAKREEEIVVDLSGSNVELSHESLEKHLAIIRESDKFVKIVLPLNSDIVKLLQRIRDESHRFAVSYHTVLKGKRQIKSVLDELPGIGPASKKKLMRKFGSLAGIKEATHNELVDLIGESRAKIIDGLKKDLK